MRVTRDELPYPLSGADGCLFLNAEIDVTRSYFAVWLGLITARVYKSTKLSQRKYVSRVLSDILELNLRKIHYVSYYQSYTYIYPKMYTYISTRGQWRLIVFN